MNEYNAPSYSYPTVKRGRPKRGFGDVEVADMEVGVTEDADNMVRWKGITRRLYRSSLQRLVVNEKLKNVIFCLM